MAKEEKKLRVLKAASDCFARFGYEKTTLEDIGKAVGLNKASLYYYYKNKEDIFCDVISQEVDQYLAEVQKKVKASRTAETKIQSYLQERVNVYRMLMNLHNLSMDTIRRFEPIYNDLYEKMMTREETFVADIIREGIVDGEFQKVDAPRVAHALLTVAVSIRYRGLHISHVRMAGEADYAKMQEDIRFVVKLVLDGIKVG